MAAVAETLEWEMLEMDASGPSLMNELHFFPRHIPPPVATLAASHTGYKVDMCQI